MKALITSPEALLHPGTNTLNQELVDCLHDLVKKESLEGIIILSSNRGQLRLMPQEKPFFPFPTARGTKMRKNFIQKFIEANPGVLTSHHDFIVLGANDGDAVMCFNNNTILLSARWLTPTTKNTKIFKYGIPIESSQELCEFLNRYLSISEHYFYELEGIDDTTSLYALVQSNTMGRMPEKLRRVKTAMIGMLKGNREQQQELAHYLLLSMYNKLDVLTEIDYWAIYPSSSAGEYNEFVSLLKEDLRLLYNKPAHPEVFERHTDSTKRHHLSSGARVSQACSTQFATIRLNPYYKEKLEGKTVCVLDDFTTTGSSCETARHLLNQVGVEKVVFITIGKFGRDYTRHEYTLDGDVFGDYTAQLQGSTTLSGNINTSATEEIGSILSDIL
jgi:hypothetical protein